MRKTWLALCICLSLQGIAQQIDTWTFPPDTISSGSTDSSAPSLGMDSDGNVVAVWIENGTVVSKSKPLNSSWSSLSTISSTTASVPQVVVDPDGNATAIWVQNSAIKVANKPFGSSWSSSSQLSTFSASAPYIAVRSNGDLVAVWIESNVVKSSSKSFGGSWSLIPATLSSSGASNPSVAIGEEGTVIAAWDALNSLSQVNTVFAANKAILGTWSAATSISDATMHSAYPRIAIDADGNAIVIWFSYALADDIYSEVALQASILDSSTFFWSSPTTISKEGVKNPASLKAVVRYNSTGVPVVAWTNSYDGSTYQIETSQKDENLAWLFPSILAGSLYSYSIDLSFSPANDLFAAYMTWDSANSSIVIQTIESRIGGFGSGSWSFPYTISDGTTNGYPLIAAANTSGTDTNAVAIWSNFDGANNILQAVAGSGTLVIPPSSPEVSQGVNNSGIFSEYYNTVSWSASSDPNLLGYFIYRNDIIIGSSETSSLTFTDHNQIQNASVTYGVSALDNTGKESTVVYVSFP